MFYVIAGLIFAVLLAPRFIWGIYVRYRYSNKIKDFASKPFVCPMCGHRFYTRQRMIHPIGEDRAYLKCPSCGKRNVCGRPYDFDC